MARLKVCVVAVVNFKINKKQDLADLNKMMLIAFAVCAIEATRIQVAGRMRVGWCWTAYM